MRSVYKVFFQVMETGEELLGWLTETVRPEPFKLTISVMKDKAMLDQCAKGLRISRRKSDLSLSDLHFEVMLDAVESAHIIVPL
jgi:hypothetical protein